VRASVKSATQSRVIIRKHGLASAGEAIAPENEDVADVVTADVADGNAAVSAAGTGELDYLAVIEGQLEELRLHHQLRHKEGLLKTICASA
jgi:hypothetical protein